MAFVYVTLELPVAKEQGITGMMVDVMAVVVRWTTWLSESDVQKSARLP